MTVPSAPAASGPADPGDPAESVPPPAGSDRPPRPGSAGWWRRSALRLRAGLAFALMAMVLSSAMAVAAYALVRTNLLDERQTVAQSQAYTNARLLRTRLDPVPPDMSQLLAGLQVGGSGDSLLQVDDRWFSSSVEVTPSDLPPSLLGVVGDGAVGRQTVEVDGVPRLAVGVPVPAVDAEYYEVTSLAEVSSTLESLGRSLTVAAASATALGGLLGVAFSSVVLSPLRRFANVATRITHGEASSRLDAAGDADLEPLATSFNEMLDELDARVERERRFASDVSHEIKGPVAALASAVSIVDRRRDQLPAEIRPVVDALDDQVTAFNQLVLDLLEISRFDARTASLDPAPLDLVALCRRVLDERGHEGVPLSVERSGEGRVVVGPPAGLAADGDEVAEAGAAVEVVADRRRLEQVVANLLDNARAYAGGATDVTVTQEASRVLVAVEDRGPGVDPSEREEIFTRFRRGRAADAPGADGGTGLGLALSTQHVSLHGGRMWVEDRPGGGARFVVELPGVPT